MLDELNQKISGFIDGELSHDETMDLLKKLESDDGLKTKLCRYQAISQALKTDTYYEVAPSFSRQVFQEIQHEPAYFLPQLKQKSVSKTQTKHPNRTRMFAVAASTVAAVVLIGQQLRHNPAVSNNPTISSLSASTQQPLVALNTPDKLKQTKRQPLNAQFNEYLQAHNSSVYTNGEADFQPYAKVASFGQR